MSYQQQVNEIAEMFPRHKRSTIENILRDMNGNADNAISILLDTPEDINTPDRQPQMPPQYPPGPMHQPPPPQGYPGYPGYPPTYAPPPQAYPGAPPAAYPPRPSYAPPPSYQPPQPGYPQPNGYPGAFPVPQPAQPPAQPKPAPQQLPKFDHIFSQDFLRWPSNAEVVKVGRDGMPINQMSGSGMAPPVPGYPGYPQPSYPQSYGIGIPMADPNDDPMSVGAPQININSDLIPGVTTSEANPNSWWNNFKGRFQSNPTTQYNQMH